MDIKEIRITKSVLVLQDSTENWLNCRVGLEAKATRQFSQFSVESCKTRTDLVILISVSYSITWTSPDSGRVDGWDCQRLLFFPHFNTKFFIGLHWKKSYLSTLSLWTWRRAQWVSLFCVIVDRIYVFRRLRAENERSHVATETGMLKQDFSAINVSLNNSWVTGGIEIVFCYDGCGHCLVLNVLE